MRVRGEMDIAKNLFRESKLCGNYREISAGIPLALSIALIFSQDFFDLIVIFKLNLILSCSEGFLLSRLSAAKSDSSKQLLQQIVPDN